MNALLRSLLPAAAAALLMAFTVTAHAEKRPWEKAEFGDTLYVSLKNAPYPHASREEGFKGRSATYPKDPHYVDSTVGLFVPKGFKPDAKTDLIFYFHGHGNNVKKTFTEFGIREQLTRTGRNAILVLPQGPRDASDSGCGKLEEKNGLKNLADEVLTVLAEEEKIVSIQPGNIVLTGHSGAYKVISFCLEHGGLEDNVREVYLLDATYGRLDQYAAWVERQPKARLASIFTEHLAPENVTLMADLSKRDVPSTLRLDVDASPDLLAKSRVTFLYTTTLDHNGTTQWMEKFLAAGK